MARRRRLHDRLGKWAYELWHRKAWFLALVLYKVGEDRLLGWVNDMIDGLLPVVAEAILQFGPIVTWLLVPLVVIYLLIDAYRDAVRPERVPDMSKYVVTYEGSIVPRNDDD